MNKSENRTNSQKDFYFSWKDDAPDYVAYTVGVWESGPNKIGGAAYMLVSGEKIVREAAKSCIGTTVNRMALLAIISALNNTPKRKNVRVYTNSEYCILVAGKKKVQKNLDLVRMMQRLIKERNVHITYTDSHSLPCQRQCVRAATDARRRTEYQYNIANIE